MKITIETIPHAEHRPEAGETVGDWTFGADGALTVRVSALGNPDYEFLVGLHEMIEAWLCRKHGVSQEAVDAFDRQHGAGPGEPGDRPDAPYWREHASASYVEWYMSRRLDIDWDDYDKALLA